MLEVTAIKAWCCRFPLPEPFPLGSAMLSEREYALVRVETAGGLAGAAFGLTRGAPLDVVVERLLAPPILGRDAGAIGALRETWDAALPHHAPEGLVARARSLIELAAWDVLGKATGKPVWSLLGGGRETAPVMLVEGYELAGESDEDFALRVQVAADEGFGMVKIANSADPERTTRRLELVRALTGPDLGLTLDVGYTWSDQMAAVEQARRWSALGLTWIEDPLHGHHVTRLARLREEIDTPLAVGDEVTNAATALALVQAGAVDVLRLDATCLGGFTALAELHASARAAGVAVSAHVYPEVHRHFVFSHADAGPVEVFRPDTPFDATAQFVAPPPLDTDPSTGRRIMRAPTAPGLGLEIDWERVERHAV